MNVQIKQVLEQPTNGSFVYGQGAVMRALDAMAAEIARTDISVLLVGESGTGKEVYARRIHRLSGDHQAPLRKMNCASLSPETLMAQVQDCLGGGAESHCPGTLFLDGVEELNADCQRRLLSLLPDGEPASGQFSRVRLISSASRSLEREVEAGRFRRELFFRINGVCLRLPALRERKEDIRALLEHFLARYAGELKKAIPSLSGEATELLLSHHWPGNIRELENMAKQIVVLGDSKLALGDIQTAALRGFRPHEGERASSLKVAARAASRRTERELILKALEHTRWNRKRAAQELQISYKSLLYKIKQIGMQEPETNEL
jgi:two-component system, NtrC family, response regulator AtoC